MANELMYGSQTVLYAAKEATYGTPVHMAGTYAFYTLSESLTPEEERINRPDRSGSPDILERIRGRRSASWEITKLFLPNGNVTTTPDDHVLWENLFGRASLGTTSIEYVLATAHDDSISLRRGIRTGGAAGAAEFQEHITGAIVNRGEIAWGNQGNDGLVQVTFSGMGKRWGFTGNTSLAAVTVNLAVDNMGATFAAAKQVSEDSLIMIGSDTGGGSGILVNTVNYTNNVITWTDTLDATHSGGNVVKPYNPTESTAGSPIHARLGYLSLDGSTSLIQHLGGRVTFEDNRSLLNEEVGSDSPTRVLRDDRRNVTFQLDFLLKKEEVGTLLADMTRDTGKDIEVSLGTEANKKLKLIMANSKFDMSAVEVPDQANMRVSMTGVALGTNGNDSLKARIL